MYLPIKGRDTTDKVAIETVHTGHPYNWICLDQIELSEVPSLLNILPGTHWSMSACTTQHNSSNHVLADTVGCVLGTSQELA